jgi:D-serine deaminase-like pyridoxal phosphate-dependent protein
MDYRNINRIEPMMKQAKGRRRHQGHYCPCCSCGGSPQEERKIVTRSQRRLNKEIIKEELEEYLDS